MSKRKPVVKNPFADAKAAKRYHEFRPRYHDIAFKKLKKLIGRKVVGKKFADTLDVACGTGHSTVSLAKISKRTIGCDNSQAMLIEARKHSDLEFVNANAEHLPFEDESFDLLNISMAIHWVDQAAFLKEARRVLRKGGYLTIDNFFVTQSMVNNAAFTEASGALYDEYLPSAARHKAPTTEFVEARGFKLGTQFAIELLLPFTLDEYAHYVMTQSNFLALSKLRQAKVKKEIYRSFRPIFGKKKQKIRFLGTLKVFKRK
jgi:ubiquinone/menaquinone biosynthesis C-methylase UbiE